MFVMWFWFLILPWIPILDLHATGVEITSNTNMPRPTGTGPISQPRLPGRGR